MCADWSDTLNKRMLRVSRLGLKNWRNFADVDVAFGERLFLIGPNASGKSNLLDVFRFLRDVCRDGGGLQQAVQERGGVSKIRSLSARRDPAVEIEVDLTDSDSTVWTYAMGFAQQPRGHRRRPNPIAKADVGENIPHHQNQDPLRDVHDVEDAGRRFALRCFRLRLVSQSTRLILPKGREKNRPSYNRDQRQNNGLPAV